MKVLKKREKSGARKKKVQGLKKTSERHPRRPQKQNRTLFPNPRRMREGTRRPSNVTVLQNPKTTDEVENLEDHTRKKFEEGNERLLPTPHGSLRRIQENIRRRP